MLQSPREERARLDELIALLGCNEEVAPIDVITFRYRTGALIARAAGDRLTPPQEEKADQAAPAQDMWWHALFRALHLRFLGPRSPPGSAAATGFS